MLAFVGSILTLGVVPNPSGVDVFSLPPQLQSLLAVGMWVIIGAGVIGTAAAGVSMWANLRRKPSAEETFATKAEVMAIEARMGVRIDQALHGMDQQQKTIMDQLRALFAKSDASARTLNEHAKEMERAVGKIEGQIEGLKDSRT